MIFRCRLVTVLTGTLISAAMKEHSVLATFSITNVYKEGNLSIQQAGKSMSAKVMILCKKCPLVRRGEWIRTDVALCCCCRRILKHPIHKQFSFLNLTFESVASDYNKLSLFTCSRAGNNRASRMTSSLIIPRNS